MVSQSKGDKVIITILSHRICYWLTENSSKIEVAIATSPVAKHAVDLYLELVTMTTKLEGTRCSNLYHYVSETTHYWKHKLDDKISR